MQTRKNVKTVLNCTLRLLANGINYRIKRWRGSGWNPTSGTLEITRRCICRCIMCNIWKTPREVHELSVDDWLYFLASPLLKKLKELDLTGGEPYLVKDLPELVEGICRLKRKNLKDLRSVIVTTNGILSEKVIEITERMVKALQAAGLELVIVCALDGLGVLHDNIRGFEGAWNSHRRTLKGLLCLRERYPNLVLGLKTTVVPWNVDKLEKIGHYAGRFGLFSIVSPVIITSGRYGNKDRESFLRFSPDEEKELLGFYRSSPNRWRLYSQQMFNLYQYGTIKRNCTCGYNYFFIRSNGDVYFCPLAAVKVGNVLEKPIDRIWASSNAIKVRKTVGSMEDCSYCTEPGLERYSLPYEGFALIRYLIKNGMDSFVDLYDHMGLDKYL